MNTDKYLIELASEFADILDGLTKGEDKPVRFALILACPTKGEDRVSTSVTSNFANPSAPVIIMEQIVNSHKKGEFKQCQTDKKG